MTTTEQTIIPADFLSHYESQDAQGFTSIVRAGDRYAVQSFRESVTKEASDGVLTHLISTSTPDRANDVMEPKSFDIKNFLANPVVLWMHDHTLPPVGKSVGVMALTEGVLAKTRFDMEDDFAAKLYRLYTEGYMNAFSVGFIPVKWVDEKAEDNKSIRRYTKVELLEYSCVTVPMNAEALSHGMKSATEAMVRKAIEGGIFTATDAALGRFGIDTAIIAKSAEAPPEATPVVPPEVTPDDTLATLIDAAHENAAQLSDASKRVDFADTDALASFKDSVVEFTKGLTALSEFILTSTNTTSPHMDNETKTTTEEVVVEKAGKEFSDDNLKALTAHIKAIHKCASDMKGWFETKGYKIDDDTNEGGGKPDGDNDADDAKGATNENDDIFQSDKAQAFADSIVKRVVESLAPKAEEAKPEEATPEATPEVVPDPVAELAAKYGL